MPSLAMLRVPPPTDSKEFEELCKDYLKYEHKAAAQLYGRSGQDQKGIDIVVTLKDNSVICAQCKDVKKVTAQDLDEWILEAERFEYPMREFVIMVAVENDTKLQDHILDVNKHRAQEKKATVKLVFWDDIVQFINKDPKIFSSYYPDLFSAMNKDHHWDDTNKIRKSSERKLNIADVRRFLLGRNSGMMYWNLIASGQIVRREIVDSLLDCTNEPGIYVLTGAGGEGKTTALMQLGSELVKKEKSVFFCNGRKPLPFPDSSMIEQGSVFLLDNALGYSPFVRLLEQIQELVNDKDVSFIMAARENEWNVMERNTTDYSSYFSGLVNKIPMRNVTKEEARLFASCIKKYLTTPKDEAQIRVIFQKNSYGFLYASMLLSVSQKNTLDEIANDIINNLQKISPDSLLVLAFAVMSEQCGTEFSQELFRKLLYHYKLNEKQVRYDLSKELVLNAGKYQTRHPVISELFYQEVLDHLRQPELDGVVENLVLLRTELYNQLSGYRRWAYWSGVKAVIQAVSLADSDSQEHIFQRLLDDTKSKVPVDFYTLYDLIGNNITQSIFIRICFERNRLSMWNLRNWALQDLVEQPWDYTVPYSAAWFFRGIYDRISAEVNIDKDFWKNWATFEEQYRGLGAYEQENSARWIYREGCVNRNISVPDIWEEWGRLEAENGNLGDYTQENSARWIYWEACVKRNIQGENIWLAWGRLESEKGKIGDYNLENSARWIYREACVKRNFQGESIWQAWGRLEAENENLGDYTQENSARWIYREACVNRNIQGEHIWQDWGRLEAENGNLGDYTQENSVRWIYREACVNRKISSLHNWVDWGRLEAESGNIGDYDQENSTRWIFSTGIHNGPKGVNLLYSNLAVIELKYGTVEKARHILEGNYLNNGVINGLLAILTIICGNGKNGPLLEELLMRLKNYSSTTISTMRYLYYCYLLLGDEISAESIKKRLSIHYDIQTVFNESFQNHINTFISLCRLANEGKTITDTGQSIDGFFIDDEIES